MRIMILFMAFLTFCSAETPGQNPKIGEEFTLRNKQSARVENTGIEITVNRIGRKWVGSEEKLDLQFNVNYKGETANYSSPLKEAIFAGDFEIKVVKTNPFGTENAVFVVNKKAKEARLGEKFTLSKGESIAIGETDFRFVFDSVEYEVLRATNGQEVHYYRLHINYKGEKKSEIIKENVVRIDAYDIRCEPPYDKQEVAFTVTKATDAAKPTDAKDAVAAKFVEKFGWHIDDAVKPSLAELDFPQSFSGLPFYHYQSASMASGVDMTPLLGKKVEMRRYTLKEKTTRSGQGFTMYVHLIIENGEVMGAWRTDSSASAPGISSMVRRTVN